MRKAEVIAFTIIVGLAVLARILPHVPNVAPVTALALYSGAYLGKRISILLPLIVMFLADSVLGVHNLMIFVYGSFLMISMIGIWLGTHKSVKNTIYATLLSSVLFFLTTNFGVWLEGRIYEVNLKGLLECYVMALPFLRNTLIGDFFYVSMFFGLHALVTNLSQVKDLKKV